MLTLMQTPRNWIEIAVGDKAKWDAAVEQLTWTELV